MDNGYRFPTTTEYLRYFFESFLGLLVLQFLTAIIIKLLFSKLFPKVTLRTINLISILTTSFIFGVYPFPMITIIDLSDLYMKELLLAFFISLIIVYKLLDLIDKKNNEKRIKISTLYSRVIEKYYFPV